MDSIDVILFILQTKDSINKLHAILQNNNKKRQKNRTNEKIIVKSSLFFHSVVRPQCPRGTTDPPWSPWKYCVRCVAVALQLIVSDKRHHLNMVYTP